MARGNRTNHPRKKNQFCPNGHDVFITGRYPSGNCIVCMRKDPTSTKRGPKPKLTCSKGHNKDLTGRTNDGECLVCVREYTKKRCKDIKEGIVTIQHIKQFCIWNHDISICGRDKYGSCKDCKREYKLAHKEEIEAYQTQYNIDHAEELREYFKNWYVENREEILAHQKEYADDHREEIHIRSNKYYADNRDEILERQKEYNSLHPEEIKARRKKWAKENPDIVKLLKLKSDIERRKRVVPWDQQGLREFYKNKPDWAQGDHIIPLRGEKVSGLHVSWNLQYLTPKENSAKNNHIDLLEASAWYGKLLEKEGLKDKI